MMSQMSSFPYFVQVTSRPLHVVERQLLEQILAIESPEILPQLEYLRVVGRCGCGKENCLIVFFETHFKDKPYDFMESYIGLDDAGGLVGVCPMLTDGRLAQLDFYSVDGHEPYNYPMLTSLKLERLTNGLTPKDFT
jgi:hypothetical protein